MLIINADDWGRSQAETDAALSCYREGRISSVSAMLFMEDSERAAELAKANGIDAGLHLNLSQEYNGRVPSAPVRQTQNQIVRFMTKSKYALLIYHPILRRQFRDLYQSQLDEFMRLYGKAPSHVDGHQHRHLCANMLIDEVIPRGQKVRRNFSFWPGEKGPLNRAYRSLVDKRLARRYRLTDFFFSLGECLKGDRLQRVTDLAKTAAVELMTHPINAREYSWLTGADYFGVTEELQVGSYAVL